MKHVRKLYSPLETVADTDPTADNPSAKKQGQACLPMPYPGVLKLCFDEFPKCQACLLGKGQRHSPKTATIHVDSTKEMLLK